MKINGSRRGSALLMVLGMLAFMIVSAVGFSAYMRYSRLPSSYLRRNNSSRLLAKAALARAIDAVDKAIGNNPHPNVGGGNQNRWIDRMFAGAVTSNGTGRTSMTATPLCVEALAYIPPGLVNEARYYSRSVASCDWHTFPFDIGRYSYLAIDVSDYFDINRLMADIPRSSAPSRRISLSYLFENADHSQLSNAAQEWDEFMENFRRYDEETLEIDFNSKYPLVSLADFNLALGEHGKIGDLSSPFYDYIAGNESTRAGFYNTSSFREEEAYRRMTFVTDGWFPSDRTDTDEENGEGNGGNSGNANGEKKYDITDSRYQPFSAEALSGDSPPSPASIILGENGFINANNEMGWLKRLSGLGLAALFDYLDADHYPLSLAIPTCERHPMICGVKPELRDPKLTVEKKLEPENDVRVVTTSGNSRTVEKTVHYRLGTGGLVSSLTSGSVKTLVAFPFARPDPEDGDFEVDGRLSIFVASDSLGLRTNERDDAIHPNDANFSTGVRDGVISAKISPMSVSFTRKPDKETDAIKVLPMRLEGGRGLQTALESGNCDLLKVVYRWNQTKPQKGGDWSPSFETVEQQGGNNIAEASCGLTPLDETGCVHPDLSNPEKVLALVRSNGARTFKFSAAVWLRVKSGDRTVDLVPACLDDDKVQNGTALPPQLTILGRDHFAGHNWPLLKFDLGREFSYSIGSLNELATQPAELKFNPSIAITSDPRFNHAPEHWYGMPNADSEDLTAENWLKYNMTSADDRDHDIFMATSDAGYLQSPAEIAFLPAFTDLYEPGGHTDSGNMESPDRAYDRPNLPANFSQTANQNLMWRTYDIWGRHEEAFNDLPWTSEGTGYKITPYSDSTNILMAVFANTPIDWRRASTNVVGSTDYATMTAKEFNSKYAINEYSQGAKVLWQDLVQVAARYNHLLHSGNVQDWRGCWNDMGWDYNPDAPEEFCGFEMSNRSDTLWTADRKFLYGYWRDCFGVSQQLFLIFVRAEPMMIGSGASGAIPPQMGARAMALVWRDPHRGKMPNMPHQTRILFYRQFD